MIRGPSSVRWAKLRAQWVRLDVGLICVTIILVVFTMAKTFLTPDQIKP